MLKRFWKLSAWTLALAIVVAPQWLNAQERKVKLAPGEANPDHDTVELFQAIADGQVEAKFIPRDAEEARLFVKNKTDKPLNIALPDAFVGMPVLAQFGGGGINGGGGGNQAAGGGLGGGGGAGGGGAGGGGFFMNVAPDKTGDLKVGIFCLEHGKAEPRPQVAYEIKPISAFTDNKAVHELCRLYGSGRLSHSATQAAAWHLSNGMSWQELIAKRIKRANGTSYPYFSQFDMQAAYQIAELAKKRALESETASPGESQQ